MIYFDEDRTKTDNSQKKGEKCLEGIKKNNTFATGNILKSIGQDT